MLGLSKKIITGKQLHATKAGKASFVVDIKKRGGDDVLTRRSQKKDLWSHLRNDSKKQGISNKGFTKNDLERSFAGMLNDKKDSITDKQLKKIIRASGVSEAKVLRYAAEMRNKQGHHFSGDIDMKLVSNHETRKTFDNKNIQGGKVDFQGNRIDKYSHSAPILKSVQQPSAVPQRESNLKIEKSFQQKEIPILLKKELPQKKDLDTVKSHLDSIQSHDSSFKKKETSDWRELLHRNKQKAVSKNEDNLKKEIKMEEKVAERVQSDKEKAEIEKARERTHEAHITKIDTRNTFGEIKNYKLNYNKHADISSISEMIKKIQSKDDEKVDDDAREGETVK
jgi:hypothetical protein